MTERKVPIQSLIDHIKTAVDIDPWAKEMAEELLKEQDDLGAELTNAVELIHKKNERIKELLKEQEAVPVIQREVMHMLVWCCGSCGVAITNGDKFCRNCGKKMKWCE